MFILSMYKCIMLLMVTILKLEIIIKRENPILF